MKVLLGDEEELPPVIPGTDCFNPVLERFWLPWARAILLSPTFIACNHPIRNAANHLAFDAIRQQIAWSVPTLPVLRYMVQTAPGGRILDVGAGTGYWSALLAGLGADVKAVDNFSWWPRQGKVSEEDSPEVRLEAQRPLYFDIQDADAADYVSVANAEKRALFFSWPKGVMRPYLQGYTGDVIFWVGEQATADGVRSTEWVMDHRMEIPQWPGSNDFFAAYRRMTPAEKSAGDLPACKS
ncbi:hypothetical protein KFL_002490160 [Klebsormidium nitens]|uniref:Uncharacterized protein n=1 Tax=Klebsormidium nitens TaxID=105231 RepID=A0A1Y1IC83_KLENI|nr:hypothetical protein KFL_002490160 [Klebsormidium nitens]|eukprot:GAQ85698.1 hypothetical protein KFL_002490160 [Klebsormidium nitens]